MTSYLITNGQERSDSTTLNLFPITGDLIIDLQFMLVDVVSSRLISSTQF